MPARGAVAAPHWLGRRPWSLTKPYDLPVRFGVHEHPSPAVHSRCCVFPDELYQAPRSWAERAYPHNLIHYNKLDRGGHFAAWEQPQLFSEEMRASFRPLRK